MCRCGLVPAERRRVCGRRCVLLERLREGDVCAAQLPGLRRGLHRSRSVLLGGLQRWHVSAVGLHRGWWHVHDRHRLLLRPLRPRDLFGRRDVRAHRRTMHRRFGVLHRSLRQRRERWQDVRGGVRGGRRSVHPRRRLLLPRVLRRCVRWAVHRARRGLRHQRRVLLQRLQQAQVRSRPDAAHVSATGGGVRGWDGRLLRRLLRQDVRPASVLAPDGDVQGPQHGVRVGSGVLLREVRGQGLHHRVQSGGRGLQAERRVLHESMREGRLCGAALPVQADGNHVRDRNRVLHVRLRRRVLCAAGVS